MASQSPDLSPFLDPVLCAHAHRKADNTQPCTNPAPFLCKKCMQSQYCSEKCLYEDRHYHSSTCEANIKYTNEPYEPRWTEYGRDPEFPQSPHDGDTIPNIWGKVPALDVLNLKNNEGEKAIIGQDLALLFAASGDLRNVLKTLVGLPKTYAGKCAVVINDSDMTVTARNVLLLLTAFAFTPEVAAPIMLHLWYSAMIPKAIIDTLRDRIFPMIRDICNACKDMPTHTRRNCRFTRSGSYVQVNLNKEQWQNLANFFEVPRKATNTEHQDIRLTVTRMKGDWRDRQLCRTLPAHRPGKAHFLNHGFLLPYCASLKTREFKNPNPTLFGEVDSWLVSENADPVDGWAYNEYIKCAGAAKNDQYGALFYYLRDALLEFCKRIRSHRLRFEVCSVKTATLPDYYKHLRFDRIEVSNSCDKLYLGPETTLSVFSPMLKTKAENPKATLLLLFLDAVLEEEQVCKLSSELSFFEPPVEQIIEYTDIDQLIIMKALEALRQGVAGATTSRIRPQSNPDFYLAQDALGFFLDFEALFQHFLATKCMDDLVRKNGLQIKSKHTIVDPWPYQLTENTTKEEFKIMFSGNLRGHERYMELERMD